VSFDISEAVLEAMRSPEGQRAIGDAVRGVVEPLLARKDPLVPLHEIVGGTRAAAHKRCGRDAQLRALGVNVGRTVLFRREEVEAYLIEKGRHRR
jgi:hypothetical protein